MKQPGALTGRVPGWPSVAGVSLGLVALVETAVRADGSRDDLPVALLMALCATVPLILLDTRPVVTALTITMGCALAVPYGGPGAAGLVAFLAAWGLLVARQVRRGRAEAARRDASRQAAESTLLELTARGERARIARELHDVVAHHISMISVQAETARLATPGMPKDGARRLQAIGDTARTALAEMRRLLGVLREDAGAEPTRRPQPGLAQLLELVDETRQAGGSHVRLIVRGCVTELDPGVELTAYRIVQEALTNVRRHAAGAAVDVELDYADHALRLRVRDNGPGPPPPARGAAGDAAAGEGSPAAGSGPGRGGHGLVGMRERVATVGGRLRTGAAPVCGFLVEADLPTARPAETGAGG